MAGSSWELSGRGSGLRVALQGLIGSFEGFSLQKEVLIWNQTASFWIVVHRKGDSLLIENKSPSVCRGV